MKLDVDKSAETPLYSQLKEMIIRQIASGELAPGMQVMSEPQMAALYGISRVTVRKALLELVEEDYLVRKQGKGTYVRSIKFNENARSVSFTDTCHALGYTPSNKIIRMRMVTANKRDQESLGVAKGSKIALMERLRYVNGIPVRLERNYYAPGFEDIIAQPLLNGSVFQTLKARFNIVSTTPRYQVEIVYATGKDAELLGIEPQSPLLRVEGVCYDAKHAPIFRTDMLHLPDRCALEL